MKSTPPRWFDVVRRGSARFQRTLSVLGGIVLLTLILTPRVLKWMDGVTSSEFGRRLFLAAHDLAIALPIETLELTLAGGEESSTAVPTEIQNLLDGWRIFLPPQYEIAVLTWRDGKLRIGPVSGRSEERSRLEAMLASLPHPGVIEDGANGGATAWQEIGNEALCATAPIRRRATGEIAAMVALVGPDRPLRAQVRQAHGKIVGMAGMIVVTALLGILVLGWRERQADAIRLRWRHVETVLTAVLGVLVMVALTHPMEIAQERDRRWRMRHESEGMCGAVRLALREIEAHHRSVVRFFVGSEYVSEAEFELFVLPLLERMPGAAVLWAPRISSMGPLAPEAEAWIEASRQMHAGSEEKGTKIAGQLAPVADVRPVSAKRMWAGRDLFCEPAISSALARAASAKTDITSADLSHPVGSGVVRGCCLVTAVRRPHRDSAEPDGWVLTCVDPQHVASVVVGRLSGSESPLPRVELHELGPNAPRPETAAGLYPLVWAGRPWLLFTQSTGVFFNSGFPLFVPMRGWGWVIVLILTLLVGGASSSEIRLERDLSRQTLALAKREEDLRVTLHSIHDGVMATDADGRITFINPEAERLTGWSAADAIGQSSSIVFRIVNGVTGEPAPDPVAQVLETGCAVGLANDTILVARDGRRVQIADSAAPIRLPGQQRMIGVVLVFRDVSEEYAARQALAESERRYRELFERMEDGFALHELLVDEHGQPSDYRFLDVNPAFERQTGLRAVDLIGRTVREVLPGTELEWIQRYGRVAFTGQTDVFESYHAPTGRYYHVTAYRTGTNQFATLFFDVTQRKRAWEEVARQRQQLHEIVESVQEGIVVLNRDLTVQFTNSTMRRWYAANLPLEGRKCYEVYHNVSEPCAGCPSLQCMSTGQPQTAVVPGLPGSEVEWVELYAYPMIDPLSGEIRGVVEFIRDITQRRRAEEERQRIEARMTEVQRLESLGVLAGGIAHDFNNILTAILGNAELASQDLPPHSPARINLLEITTAARRAAELCRQMLAYAGRGRFVAQTFDLNCLVDEMLSLLKTTISKRAVLNVHLEPNIPPIRADPSQIRQVVMNLVINASEALGDRSGTITIRTGVTQCDRQYLDHAALETDLPEGTYVVLEVADTGCGMDRATLSRIFEPFFTTKFAGRGLGLSAVMGILRAHKGGIKVYSEPGKGSLFKILLPISSENVTEATPSALALDGSETGRVLFVDDEESVRILGSRLLERMGFDVSVAADGQAAIEVFRQCPLDWRLVVLDLTMPRMGGEETFRRLREIRPDVPVILASGYTADELGARFASKGFSGFLQKPFTIKELQNAIVVALRGIEHHKRA